MNKIQAWKETERGNYLRRVPAGVLDFLVLVGVLNFLVLAGVLDFLVLADVLDFLVPLLLKAAAEVTVASLLCDIVLVMVVPVPEPTTVVPVGVLPAEMCVVSIVLMVVTVVAMAEGVVTLVATVPETGVVVEADFVSVLVSDQGGTLW